MTRVAVVTHGRPDRIGDALERLGRVCAEHGAEIVDDADAELAVVLGGDGTTLRALHRFLGTPVPCLGVNFGRVGFLTSVDGAHLEDGRGEGADRPLRGGRAADAGRTRTARRSASTTSSCPAGCLGRMVILRWFVDGAPMGELGCDGAILATPTGSTAYNLSAGGPVMAWGTDAFVISFVSPHSLHARSMVLGRGHLVEIDNATVDVPINVIVDGHSMREVPPGGRVAVRLGDEWARLARIEGTSFFSRYRETFST